MSDLVVRRDEARRRYFAAVGDQEAHIRFVVPAPGVVDLQHTEVPEAWRGHGVAAELVRQTLDDVRARGEKLIATCPYVKAFLQRHPEYQDLATHR